MSRIKAVVFDWAGTMVDFGCRAPVEALIAAFAAEGVVLSTAAARREMGMAKRAHVAAILANPEVIPLWTEAKGSAPGEADLERIFLALGPLMTEAADRCSDLIPGAAEVARDLKAQGVRIGSGTGYSPEMMAPIRRRAAEQGYEPEVVICAGDTPTGRPSPQPLWQALIRLDAWPASLCVKVDDAEVGVREGRYAGCWTIGVAASGNGVGLSLEELQALPEADRRALIDHAGEALMAAGAHLVIDTVADLPDALAEIESLIASGAEPGRAA
jgi:phosphonoacetaldehyde hydrolase